MGRNLGFLIRSDDGLCGVGDEYELVGFNVRKEVVWEVNGSVERVGGGVDDKDGFMCGVGDLV